MAQTVLKLKTTDGKFYFTGALKGLYSSFKLMVDSSASLITKSSCEVHRTPQRHQIIIINGCEK